MINYKQLEVEFFRAKSLGDNDTKSRIAGKVLREIHNLDVRCQFYGDEYGSKLDIHDRRDSQTPVQAKYEKMLLEYSEANRLGKIVSAYA